MVSDELWKTCIKKEREIIFSKMVQNVPQRKDQPFNILMTVFFFLLLSFVLIFLAILVIWGIIRGRFISHHEVAKELAFSLH